MMKHLGLGLLTLCCAAMLACPGDSGNNMPINMSATGGVTSATAGPTTATGSTSGGSTTTGPPTNCADVECIGHGSCEITEGAAACVCDEGYILSPAGNECVVDESCVQLRFLEDRCRMVVNGPPAVALFFAVDFCAGTAVTPDKLDELGLEFLVLENEVDISENVESEAQVLETSVENYVALVVDMSDSVAQSQNLGDLITELRGLVSSLQPGAGEPDVYVSVYAFGRFVVEYVPFTRDLGAVDTALAAIESDPAVVVDQVSGMGTALFTAVKEGIENTQRIRDLRAAVTNDGVLTTGTVVVVTDGKDTSNATLDEGLITETLNQVISIGISSEIEDADLGTIGRDGSFLAPDPADWGPAFAEITQRVDEYPDRSYLLAYCSSTTDGTPDVEISAIGEGVTVEHTSVCRFNAEGFSSNPDDVCNATLFETNCDNRECGGLTACGACPDAQCCSGGACTGPTTATAVLIDCDGQHDLCAVTGQVCAESAVGSDPDVCADPAPLGPGLCEPACEPKVGFCREDAMNMPISCDAVRALGEACEFPEQCVSLNCTRINEENPFDPKICRPEARVFDLCGPDDAICEKGAYCQGSACAAKKRQLEQCGGNNQCRTAVCENFEEVTVCAGPAACYWTWDEKVP